MGEQWWSCTSEVNVLALALTSDVPANHDIAGKTLSGPHLEVDARRHLPSTATRCITRHPTKFLPLTDRQDGKPAVGDPGQYSLGLELCVREAIEGRSHERLRG